jgi:hypothetical protein
VFVLHAASPTHKYNICVHSVLNIIHVQFVYGAHDDTHHHALSQIYLEYDKLKLSAQYNVIVQFDVYVAHAGLALNVGFVKSTFAAFDVKFVVLQFHALSHTFVHTVVHVDHIHSGTVHVVGFHDAIHANASAYVNVDVCVLVYHHANVVLPENTGAVLSNFIEFDVKFVVLQFHNLSHIFVHAAVHVDVADSVLIIQLVVVPQFIQTHASA